MSNTVRFENLEINTSTPMGKELLRWERPSNYRPENHPYPTTVFKAFKGDDGVIRCIDTDPNPSLFLSPEMYRMAKEKVDLFNRSCIRVVNDEIEHKNAVAEGWRDSSKEAKEALWGWEADISKAAAERAYADRNISEKAKAEVKAIEDSTPNILGEIPEAPLVKKPHPMSREARAERAAKAAASA